MSMKWIIPAAAVLLLAVAAACGGGGDDPAPTALSEAVADGQDEGPGSLPPVSDTFLAGDCIAEQDVERLAADADPGLELEPGSPELVLEVPLTVESLPDAALTPDTPPATSSLEIEREESVAVTNECDEAVSEPGDPDAPVLDGPGTPADGPIRSDEGIGPDECNLVHNIDACSDEELKQGFPNERSDPQTEPES